jgi:exosome complex component MTR3
MLSNIFIPKIVNSVQNNDQQTQNKPCKRPAATLMNFREISCDTGVINGASGSAFISFGDTKVFCAIYGPRANQRGAVSGPFSDSGLLECDVRIAATNNSHSLSSSSEPRISQQLRDALAPSVRLSCYPKAVISIYAVIVQSAGSELAAVISCASLALADASIEVNDFVCATTVGLSKSTEGTIESKPILTIDPSKEECEGITSMLTMSSMVNCNAALTHVSVEGFLSPNEFALSVELAKSGCFYLRTVFINCMKRRQLRFEKSQEG